MKHTRYCQFHKSIGNHYSSECNRNPANLWNPRITEKEHKRSSSRSYNKPTSSKLPTPKHPGKPEASKYLRKIKHIFSSSEDEKEDIQEVLTLEEEEIIKYEMSNVNCIQNIRQIKKKHKTNS